MDAVEWDGHAQHPHVCTHTHTLTPAIASKSERRSLTLTLTAGCPEQASMNSVSSTVNATAHTCCDYSRKNCPKPCQQASKQNPPADPACSTRWSGCLVLLGVSFPVPPSISGSHSMVAVVVNDPVRLECEARGIPAPSLTWLKDGSPVSSFANGIQVTTPCHFWIIQCKKSTQTKLMKMSGKQALADVF